MSAINFNPFMKRNGDLMLYVNASNRVSVGLSGSYSPYGKGMTNGKRNAIDNAFAAFEIHATEFTGDMKHGGFVHCGPYSLFVTDTANVAGHDTGEDGAFVVRDGRILKCGQWYEY